jgi:hypothetical protein
MSDNQSYAHRVAKGLVFGFAVGWIAGVVWWASLMISFGPSARVSYHGDIRHEEEIPVLSTLIFAPVVAIPWGVVGGIAGSVIGLGGGWLEVITTIGGMIGGIQFTLVTHPFDGWLTLTMPINAFIGAFFGLIIGFSIKLGIMIRSVFFVRSKSESDQPTLGKGFGKEDSPENNP